VFFLSGVLVFFFFIFVDSVFFSCTHFLVLSLLVRHPGLFPFAFNPRPRSEDHFLRKAVCSKWFTLGFSARPQSRFRLPTRGPFSDGPGWGVPLPDFFLFFFSVFFAGSDFFFGRFFFFPLPQVPFDAAGVKEALRFPAPEVVLHSFVGRPVP